jgi:hypothetical protein
MTARELLEDAARQWVIVEAKREKLFLESISGEVPADLIEKCRAHKQELLRLLRWEAQADEALLESTRTVAKLLGEYQGCSLDDHSAWDAFDQVIDRAYLNEDLGALKQALDSREQYAKEMSILHRKVG